MHLQSAIATGLSWLKPLPWAGCLQSVIAICNCNRAILAPIPSWAGSLQSVIAICNCNRVTLQLQPGICNCSRASAIVTENAHAHMQLELRLSISIIPVGYRILPYVYRRWVGWGGGLVADRFAVGWDDLFLLIYSGIAAASRRGWIKPSWVGLGAALARYTLVERVQHQTSRSKGCTRLGCIRTGGAL